MHKYSDVLYSFATFLFFSLSNIYVYYATGHHHSRVPFILSLIPTLCVLVLVILAILRIRRHPEE